MTWVLGSANMFGYGGLIADVRVVWGDRVHADILLKIHQVAPNLLVGFAGSVEVGFALIEDMRQEFALPAERYWYPRAAAWWWWRRARRMFANARPALKKLGSSVLLVGADPYKADPFGRARCIRMRSPTFNPEFLPAVSWHSIGRGSAHESARYFAEEFRANFMNTFGQFELGESRGGSTFLTAGDVSRLLAESPLYSVSEALTFGTAELSGCKISVLKSTKVLPDGTEQEVSPGALVRSWKELEQYAQRHGLSAAEASAAGIGRPRNST